MVCRHSANDPACSSNRPQVVYRDPPGTPDKAKYKVLEAEQVGPHLVMRVEYPNCQRCSYEGVKVMVFAHTNAIDALKWKEIDPHFRDVLAGTDEAPSPMARFPASDEGWQDALNYARSVVQR